MDREGNLFWRRFAIVVLASIIVGISVAMTFNWVAGLLTYLGVQWFTIPVLIRMSMND